MWVLITAELASSSNRMCPGTLTLPATITVPWGCRQPLPCHPRVPEDMLPTALPHRRKPDPHPQASQVFQPNSGQLVLFGQWERAVQLRDSSPTLKLGLCKAISRDRK